MHLMIQRYVTVQALRLLQILQVVNHPLPIHGTQLQACPVLIVKQPLQRRLLQQHM